MSKDQKKKLDALVSEAKEAEAPVTVVSDEKAKKEKHSMGMAKKRKIVNTVSYVTLSIICMSKSWWILIFWQSIQICKA